MTAAEFRECFDFAPVTSLAEIEARSDVLRGSPSLSRLAAKAIQAGLTLMAKGGEPGGASVYRIDLSDGTAYVGLTTRSIAERVAEHFGCDVLNIERRADATFLIVQRLERGCTAKVTCIASGVTKLQAQQRERSEIECHPRPLNTLHAQGRTQGLPFDISTNTVAKYF